jgi:hypothetical protein
MDTTPTPTTSARPSTTLRTCHAVYGPYRCERDHQHAGPHQGYDEQHDAPVFWETRDDT